MENAKKDCPVCGHELVVNRAGKVLVDVCKEHGMWLDSGELRQILVERKLMQVSSRTAVRRALQDGRAEGAFFGWASLFFPLPKSASKSKSRKKKERR